MTRFTLTLTVIRAAVSGKPELNRWVDGGRPSVLRTMSVALLAESRKAKHVK